MGWLEPTHLMIVLVAIAIVAAIWIHTASVIAQAKKRRARRFFVLGFSVGWTAATVFGGRRRRPKTLQALVQQAKRIRPLSLARSFRYAPGQARGSS